MSKTLPSDSETQACDGKSRSCVFKTLATVSEMLATDCKSRVCDCEAHGKRGVFFGPGIAAESPEPEAERTARTWSGKPGAIRRRAEGRATIRGPRVI